MGRLSVIFCSCNRSRKIVVDCSLVKKGTDMSLRIILLLSTVSFSAVSNGAEVLVDRISGIVNSVPILNSEVQEKIRRGQVVLVSSYPAPQDADDQTKALQDEINFELVMQKVDELDLNVSDTELDTEIQGFLTRRKLSMDGLLEALHQQGVSYEEYKTDFRKQMIMRKFQGRVIQPLIKITDKDLESYLLKKSGATVDNLSVTLRKIFIRNDSDTAAVARGKESRVQQVYSKLKSGMNFEEAAKLYSDDADAQTTGGLMSPVKLNELSTNIKKEIAPLEEGGFTNPIESDSGFFIFALEKKNFLRDKNFQAQKQQLEFELRNEELQRQTQKWIIAQRRRSKIEIIKL